ncbi:hypothetical protein D3C74_367170 [compost metagenome]
MFSRLQIITKWFFDHQTVPTPTFQHTAVPQTVRDTAKQLRCQCQIEQPVPRRVKLRFQMLRLRTQLFESVHIIDIQCFVFKMIDKSVPLIRFPRRIAAELFNGFIDVFPEFFWGPRTTCYANNRKVIGKLAFTVKTVDSRKQLPAGQITRCSKNEKYCTWCLYFILRLFFNHGLLFLPGR